jgi:hypothetical protein
MLIKVKNIEPFKDGNVIGGRFLSAGEIVVLDELDVAKVRQSGGLLEEIERMIPNPLKTKVEEVEPVEAQVEEPRGKKAHAKK